ncbi:MAG: hypothetical protein ACI8X3_000574 [Saprospiraceae bacterium]|jgi:hypothetical protein
MKNLNILSALLTVLLIVGLFFSSLAQTDKEILAELAAEEQEAINALVLYPEDTRLALLNATQYPEALIKMESIQAQTSSAFKTLMQQYPQSTQEMIWDLTRYPDLIPSLLATKNKSSGAVEQVVKDYPEVIRPRARQATADHFQLLASVNEMNQMAESAFETLLDQYPLQTRESLQQLIALPEVLTILTENIRLTVLVGDLYKKEPVWLLQKADSLSLEVARQNAKELEDWKESLENDPEAMEELKASAGSFAEEYAYDDDEYDAYYSDDQYDDEQTDRVTVNYHYNYNYPYWLGYPYWHEYPRWRYYPYWYDWGFYFGPRQTIIVVGLPSYHFTHWYFYHPYHHSYYPHLSTRFTNHYYGHRNGTSSVTSGVSTWRNQNKEIVTETWLKDDGKLPNRFKEYGKLETERERYNKKNPKKTLSRKEYVTRNSKRYPEISKSVKESKNDQVIRKKPDPTVPVRPDSKRPVINNPKVPKPRVDKVSPRPKVKKTVPEKPKVFRTVPKVDKAKDYHRDTWKKSKTSRRQPTTPRVMPKIKRAPTVPRRTKPKTKPRKPNG